MVKITLEKAEDKTGHGTWKVCLSHPQYGKMTLCYAYHWAFASCGVDSFDNFYNSAGEWAKKEVTDEFVKFFTAHGFHFPTDGWPTHEYVFAITNAQATGYLRHLVAHPKVKMIDRFTNKAHGPHEMYLFRLSSAEDFKRPLIDFHAKEKAKEEKEEALA